MGEDIIDDRKQYLKQKLKISKQKNQRKVLIDKLNVDTKHVIENAEIITSPDLEKILESVNSRWNNELNSHDFIIKYEDNRKEYSWESEVIEHFAGLVFGHKNCYLFLGIQDSPIYHISGEWIIENFEVIWKNINYDDIWIISPNIKRGILLTQYAGYLEHDPNPNREMFYTITEWDDE